MDDNDPLRTLRERFHIPKRSDGANTIYFCGNSLGLQPKAVRQEVELILRDWETQGVEAHFQGKEPWVTYHNLLNEQTATIVGAFPEEVTVMNGLTVNLHLMLVSFYRPTKERHRIMIEANAFPSDQYAIKSHIRFHGHDPARSLIEFQPREGETRIRTEDIETFLSKEGDSVALVMLGGVNYYTGQAFEIERITRSAHAKGCIAGYDLAHSAGNVKLQLHDWDVDFAVWCSYKYLNSGPGGVAGCFVHRKHGERDDLPRFAGWWGHDKETRFLMGPDFWPIPGAEGWQVSNAPILALAAQRASVQIFDDVGMDKLRAKSELLTGYLEFLLDQKSNGSYSIITPPDKNHRGAQLSVRIKEGGKGLLAKLADKGVVVDWREPDVIRVAPVPMYNTFTEVYDFVETFSRLLGSEK